MVVGSIISIIFIYYCDENKRNKAKLPVCHIVCQNEKSSVEGHITGGIWNDSDKEKDGLCPTV